MTSAILFLLGIIYYYYFYNKTKDSLNPIGIFLIIWCITASISALYLSPLQQKWNFEMIFIVIGSSIAVFFSGYIFIPKIKIQRVIEDISITRSFIILTRVIFIISLICVLIEWKSNSYFLPGIATVTNGIDIKSLAKAIPGVHYGALLMPYCGIFAFYEFKYSKKNKVYCIAVILFSVVFYSFMVTVSRGNLLGIFLSFIFIQHKFKPISLTKLVFSISIILILFVGIAFIRLPENSKVFTSLGDSRSIYGYISPIYSYIAYNFENLFKLVSSNNTYTFFHYSLKPVWEVMGLGENLNLTFYDTSFFNARTYLYPFYHDLGFLGALIFPFLIGAFLSIIYKKSYNKPQYILMLAVLQKGIANTFFGNYFFGEFGIMWPYIVTGIVIISLKKQI